VDNDDMDPLAHQAPIVADAFPVPSGLTNDGFRLVPLDISYNVGDYAAWTASVDHIRATPGYEGRDWPDLALTLEDNERDLAGHADHFARRVGFTYTVLDPASPEVIGCVYIYPPRSDEYDVDVRSWVRADRADLDKPLYEAVREWLRNDWPFTSPHYAAR
jgi:hypothetical protein